MNYKSGDATGRGSSDVLKIMENDLREPAAGEAQIKIPAVGVCQDDILNLQEISSCPTKSL